MNYRPLGATGLTISEIGFGCWGIGGVAPGTKSYGPVDDTQSIRALWRAHELGVTFFDTSDLYGVGHSETVLASAFAGKRGDVILASKVGFVVGAEGTQHQDFSETHIRKSLDGSLRRLKTDHLDLYQLHDPAMDALQANPHPVEVMKTLQREGKIKAWGISARSPADGLVAVSAFGAPAIQINFNMIDQRAVENGLLALCGQRNIGVIGRTPLCFGFLTGCYTADTTFDPADHRAGWSREQIALWASAPALFRAAIKPPVGQTAGQLAIRYCLSYAAVSTVIPGILRASEADENVAAGGLGALDDEGRRAAEKVYREHVFFAPRRGGS